MTRHRIHVKQGSKKGPARKYYRITPAVELELQRARDAWSHLTGLVAGLTQGETS